MKRASPLRTQGIRSSDPFTNLSVDQLAHIGAIAMLYNDLEEKIDEMCALCLDSTVHPREVLSRINGIEGKIEIVKHAAQQWGFSEAERAELGETFGQLGFQQLKGLRDAVVHARVFDITSSVARTRARKGKVADVLLAQGALETLLQQLEEMRCELYFVEDILARKRRVKRGGLDDPHKARLEAENLDAWTQVRVHRSQRLSLPQVTEWPEDKLDFGPLRPQPGQLEN